MADVTTTFGARDESFARTVEGLQGRLAGFSGSVDSFNSRVTSIATGFRGLVGPIVGLASTILGVNAALAAFKGALDLGSRLHDLTKATKASAGDLAILERAFDLAGASGESVGLMLNRLNRFMAEAGSGAKTQTETLARLGISFQDLASKTPLEQMQMLANRIGAIGSPALTTAASMEIFGRTGHTLIPLFKNFNAELEQAKNQLGSLPEALNRSADNLERMDDILLGLSTKFTEFTIGMIDGIRASDDFAESLSNIDTAGLGQNFGQALRVAFEQPLLTSKIIGETLLLGAKIAGNALINGLKFAAESFVKTISTEDYAIGIGERIRAGLMEAVNGFNKLLAFGIEKIFLQPLSNIPGIVGDPFRAALASVKEIQLTLDKTSQANWKLWTEGGDKISGSLQSAVNSTAILEKDWLDAAGSADNIASNIMQASNSVATIMAPAAERFVTAAQEAALQLHKSAVLSAQITLDFQNANLVAQEIPAAFLLGKTHSAGIFTDINSASARIAEATGFLEEGANASATIGINGGNFAAATALAANNMRNVKVDAEIASVSVEGMSERMAAGADAVNASLDLMREAHHFAALSAEEVQQKLTDGGMGLVEAQQAASDYMAEQSKMSSDMQTAEQKVRLAQEKLDRAEARAKRQEEANQDGAAHKTRMRAQEEFTKAMEKLAPDLEKGVETAKKMLEESGKETGDKLKDGAEEAGKVLKEAGKDVAKALKDVISPEGKDQGKNFAEQIYNFFKNEFFVDFKTRLPQNALS